MNIDLNDDAVLKSAKHVELSFSTDVSLKKANLSEQKVLEFKCDLKRFYIDPCNKIKDRSSLRYTLIGHLDCFNPKSMIEKSTLALHK